MELVRHVLAKVRSPADIEALPERMSDALTGHESLSVSIIGPDGRTLFATPGAAFPGSSSSKGARDAEPSGNPELVSWEHDGQVYHGFATSVPTDAPELPRAVVAVALNFAAHHAFMAAFYEILWLAIAAGILSTGLLGWIAARRGLAPVRDMTQRCAEHHGQSAARPPADGRLADGARRSGGGVQRHAVPPGGLVSPPVRVFVGSGARAADAHRQPDDANAGGAFAHAIGGGIPRGAVLELGGVRAARPHDRGHAVPGQVRQRADRAAERTGRSGDRGAGAVRVLRCAGGGPGGPPGADGKRYRRSEND